MNRIWKRADRRSALSAGVFAVLIICLFPGLPAHQTARAEETIVDTQEEAEASSPEQSSSQEEGDGQNKKDEAVDPVKIDGLFEVVSEKSDSKGESAEEAKKKKDEKKLIVGYVQVGVQASIHFEMGEKPSLESLRAQFPSQLGVYFLGEKKPQTLSVTWESYGDDYSTTNLNYYFFTPKFDSTKYEVKDMNLQSQSPYIEVIQNAFTYEMIESAPPKENEAAVVKFCRETLRLNTAATCGILANIYCESGFRTNAIGDGGTSVGICQWHNGRWTNLRNFAPDDWQTLEGQLRYMRKELHTGYRATLKYLRNVPDDEQGAYDAAYYWCLHYEMPDRILSRSTTRAYLAKNVYWERYAEEEETEEDGSEEEAGEETYRCVSDDGLNIREEKSIDSEALGSIPADAEVKVLSIEGEWAKVSYDGKEGYSKLEFLEKVKSSEETEEETETAAGKAAGKEAEKKEEETETIAGETKKAPAKRS